MASPGFETPSRFARVDFLPSLSSINTIQNNVTNTDRNPNRPLLTAMPLVAITHPQRSLIVPPVLERDSTWVRVGVSGTFTIWRRSQLMPHLGIEFQTMKDHVNGLLDASGYLGLPGVGTDVVEDDVERIQDARIGAKQPTVLGGHVVHAADVVDNVVRERLLVAVHEHCLVYALVLYQAHEGVSIRFVTHRVVVRLPVAKELVQTLDESLFLVNSSALLRPVPL